MASVSSDKNGTKRICFASGDGERRSVRLGKATVKAAQSFRLRIETLLSDISRGHPHDAELSAWLRDLPDQMHERLARVGLVKSRPPTVVVTLGNLLDRFTDASVVKPATRAAYKQATDSLRQHFGEDTALRGLTMEQADGWRKTIAESGLAGATVAKRIHVAKSIFRKAVKWGLMPTSPFADLRAGSQCNPDRAFYVTHESINAILAVCPDEQWRAIVALSRYAGLRCPSEIVTLRWGDVNWERGRLTVRSPKTEGHEGHAVRVVPIARELRPILLALFEQAEVGTEAVVPRLRDPSMNLRTTFCKIIARAGEKPWPRLFQNMRASCETDWVERFPAHVVAGWLGHSPLIAAKHYLQTRDAHFNLAAEHGEPATGDGKSGAHSGAPAVQNAAQHPTPLDRGGLRDDLAGESDDLEVACFAEVAQPVANERNPVQNGPEAGTKKKVGATGLEPVTSAM